jgi:hypothetical protein
MNRGDYAVCFIMFNDETPALACHAAEQEKERPGMPV